MPSHYNPDEFSQLHKTVSKSFAMQRKTLVRVLGLEGRVSELESQQAAEEQAQEGIDEILDEMLGEETKKKPAAKKRPKKPVGKKIPKKKPVAKKKKISAESLKKGTSLEPSQWFLDETARREKKKADEERHARNREETIAGDANKGSVQHRLDSDSVDATTGETLSPAERKRRFILRKKGIKVDDIKRGTSVESAENVAPNNEVTDLAVRQPAGDLSKDVIEPPKSDSPQGQLDTTQPPKASPVSDALKNAVKAIAESVDRIKDSLIGQGKVQEDAIEDARKSDEEKDAKKKESGLEKFLGPVKSAGEKILKPFKSMMSQVFDFLTTIFFGRVAFKLFEWFSNPANMDKVKSIFNFLADWWPVIVAGLMAIVGPGITFAVGLVALLAWGIPKIINAVKSVFGFGKDIDKEIKTGEDGLKKDMEKIGTDAEKKLEPEKEDKGMPSQETPAEVSNLQNSNQDVQNENVQGFNKGGEVQGSGDKDTVPAMLTPGEFVMSKGAVEQYGVNTLEGMNAAAGGTNIPTMQKGGGKGMNLGVPRFGGGGFSNVTNTETTSSSDSGGNFSFGKSYVAPAEAKERVAAMGMPSMELMDGTVVPDFGKMGGESVTQGLQLTRDIMVENGASPDRIAKVDELMAMPDAQPDSIANKINQIVPGSMENTMMNVGDSITASARMNGGGLVSNSFSNLSNSSNSISHFNGGGLIQKFNQGGLVSNLSNSSNSISHFNGGGLVSNLSNSSNSISNFNGGGLIQKFNEGGIVKLLGNKAKGVVNFAKEKIAQVSSDQKPRVDHLHLDPPKRPASKAAAAQIAQGSGQSATVNNESAPGIPTFDASSMRSQSKIRTLGVSV